MSTLPVFRWREKKGITTPGVEPALFRVRGGVFFAAVGVALTLLLATRMNANDAIKMLVVILLGSVHWFAVRSWKSRDGNTESRAAQDG